MRCDPTSPTLWLVLGSAHFLDAFTKPTNCLYLIARPDATVPKQLAINQPGMLIHDFPDGLSEGGWYHNFKPMQKRDDEVMTWGTPSKHPRQADGQAEP